MIKGSTFLITGGTGSFGKTILKFLIDKKPREIRVFSRDEKKQYDLRNQINSNIVNFIIGDIRDYDSVYNVTKNIDSELAKFSAKNIIASPITATNYESSYFLPWL